MRTFILATSISFSAACSQVKEADTGASTEPSDEPTSEPSNEPANEETEETDMPDPTQMPMVNEICADASATEDWIEIYNPTSEAVNVADWTIGDDEAEMYRIGDLVEVATVPAGGYLLVMTKVMLEDGSEIGFGLKKDGSETLFVTMFTDGWSTEVPESLGEDLSYARTPNGEFTWENGVVATPGVAN